MGKIKAPKKFVSGDVEFECSDYLDDRGVWIHAKSQHLYFNRREVSQLKKFFEKSEAYLKAKAKTGGWE